MIRKLTPEILDSLAPEDPSAIASRRNLRQINALMGTFSWFSKTLQTQQNQLSSILEIGAGDGALAIHLLKRHSQIGTYRAIDLAPRPQGFPQNAHWLQTDLLQSAAYDNSATVLANLILHHFTNSQLRQLGETINNSPIQHIIVNEPYRLAVHQWQLRAGKLIGFNHVTLHDGCVSIEAGFRGNELPELLGLSNASWHCTVKSNVMGAYRMIAIRQ